MATLDKRSFAEGMRNLSNILDANSEIYVQVGQSGRTIPVDTVNALRQGLAKDAKQYILATYPKARRGMTDAEFDEFVERKANDMVERTISLARGSQANEVLRQQQADMLTNVGGVIETEAKRVNPEGIPINQTAESLVDQRQGQIQNLQPLKTKPLLQKRGLRQRRVKPFRMIRLFNQ